MSTSAPAGFQAAEPRTQTIASTFPGLLDGDCKTHLVEFIEQPALVGRPIDRDSRVQYVGTDVSNLNFLTRQRSGKPTCHHATNRLPRQQTAHEPDRLPAEALQLPEKAVVDRLLKAYFEHVNPGFPVVDEIRFMALYEARDSSNPPSLLLLQAILVAGAHVEYEGPERALLTATFFRRAKMLFDARFERQRDVVVQAALLLTFHYDGPEDVAAGEWHWVRTASTVALGLGMHRDAEPSTLVGYNKRMWRRVFWLLFRSDVSVALQYGRPQAIRLDECDVQEPRPSDFEECGDRTQIEYFIKASELSTIVSNAVRNRFMPRATSAERRQALADADANLARWTLDLPDSLRLRPTLTLEFHATLLHLLYNAVLILLHRPRPPGDHIQEGMRPEDADICSAAASHVQALFEGLRERGLLKYVPHNSVHIAFTAAIQLCVELRMANPILATTAQRRFDSLLETLRQLAKVWPHGEPVAYYIEHASAMGKHKPLGHSLSQTDPALNEAPMDANEGANQNFGAERGTAHENDWQHLFQDGMVLQERGSALWDGWEAHYWEGPGFGSMSPEFHFTG